MSVTKWSESWPIPQTYHYIHFVSNICHQKRCSQIVLLVASLPLLSWPSWPPTLAPEEVNNILIQSPTSERVIKLSHQQQCNKSSDFESNTFRLPFSAQHRKRIQRWLNSWTIRFLFESARTWLNLPVLDTLFVSVHKLVIIISLENYYFTHFKMWKIK